MGGSGACALGSPGHDMPRRSAADGAALPAAKAAGYVTKPPTEAAEPALRAGFVAWP